MENIVEDALQNATEMEPETEVDDSEADKFGTPTCAVVGCGPAGIVRVGLVDTADATAVIADPSTLDRMASHSETQLPVVERDPAGEYDVLNHRNFNSAVTDAVGDADIIIVTGHLETAASVRLLETACRQFSTDTTVMVVPSVPQEGLSTDAKTAFLDLADTARITVPFDLTQVDGAVDQKVAGNSPLETANSLIVELISDVFGTFRGSLAAPVLRWDAAHDLFNNGGLTLLYWNWAQRGDDPEAVIERAAANRVCDGDSQTATTGFGFVRFGESFTLAEFEALRETGLRLLAPERIEDDHWVFCGDSTLRKDREYRLSCLLAGVAPESLGFM